MNSISIQTPEYYQREFTNDIGSKTEEPTLTSQCKRVALVALPFLSLYAPLGFSISLGMGSFRVISNASSLYEAYTSGSQSQVIDQFFQTTLSVASIAGTVFAHPLGMLISTAHDLAIESAALANHLQKGDVKTSIESAANIVNNALYLAMFFGGGLELSIASLGLQILIGLVKSREELLIGNYLEASGHLAMAAIRGNQLKGKVHTLQVHLEAQHQLEEKKKEHIAKLAKAIEELEQKISKEASELDKSNPSSDLPGSIQYWAGLIDKKGFSLDNWSWEDGKDNLPRMLLACLLSENPDKVLQANLFIQMLDPLKIPTKLSLMHCLFYGGGYDDFSTTIFTTILYRCQDVLLPETTEHLLSTLLPFDGGEFSYLTPRTFGLLEDTENHILMTNSSKYLKNQWLHRHQNTDPKFDNATNGLEQDLLKKLNEIKENGLDEYNSTPYTAYSVTALMNLAAYGSGEVQSTAKTILDNTNRAYALSSCGLKQFSPYRRQAKYGNRTSLTLSYLRPFLQSWMGNRLPTSQQSKEKDMENKHGLIADCISDYKLPEDVQRILAGEDTEEYLTQISHSNTSIGGSPELYWSSFADGVKYLLSSGGAFLPGKYRDLREIMTRPTTLMIDDNKTELKDLFYLGTESALADPCKDAYLRNNTGVYKDFACGACPVHIPKEMKATANQGNWSIYQGVEGLSVAVYNTSTLGILVLFKENPSSSLLDSIVSANSITELANSFQFPDGSKLTYDTTCSQDKWVMTSEVSTTGEVRSFERDFTKWDQFRVT